MDLFVNIRVYIKKIKNNNNFSAQYDKPMIQNFGSILNICTTYISSNYQLSLCWSSQFVFLSIRDNNTQYIYLIIISSDSSEQREFSVRELIFDCQINTYVNMLYYMLFLEIKLVYLVPEIEFHPRQKQTQKHMFFYDYMYNNALDFDSNKYCKI